MKHSQKHSHSVYPNTAKATTKAQKQESFFKTICRFNIIMQIHTRSYDFDGIILAIRNSNSKIGSKRDHFGDTHTDTQTQAFQIDRHSK